MAHPVLVRAYTSNTGISTSTSRAAPAQVHALPPISSYAFADILRTANCPDLQNAIDGIAELCAKNRMSLADEYSSHLPPLGEITSANRPAHRRALTVVPEVSSSSSEGSVRSQKRTRSLFSFRKQTVHHSDIIREITIGRMGRTIPVSGTTAIAKDNSIASEVRREPRLFGDAIANLHRILNNTPRSAG